MPNFSGVWTLQEQFEAITEGNWTGLRNSFELYALGEDDNGRLGLNSLNVDRSSPVQVGSLTTWSKIADGNDFSIARFNNGELFSWGSGFNGRLGLNETTDKSSPVQIGALTNWSQISAGGVHAASVKTDGTLWTWGEGNNGRLGDNTTIDRSSPVQIGALTNWAKVSAGAYSCLAVTTGGELYGWGLNQFGGNVGDNTIINRSSPVQIGALTNWSDVSAGAHTSFAIKTDGTLWAWGRNSNGQLGLNDTTYRSSPVQIGALTTWLSLATGDCRGAMLAIKTDNTLWAWGENDDGQIGDNTTVNKSSPVQIGGSDWLKVASSFRNAFAVTTSGELYAWGNNQAGQLGQNDLVNRSSPVQIGSLTDWSEVSTGNFSAHAILSPRTGM